MAEIFTPQTLWKDITINTDFNYTRTETFVTGDIVVEKFYIDGKKTQDGVVKIFVMSAKNTKHSNNSSIILFNDLSKPINEQEGMFLAKDGYDAYLIDCSGMAEGKKEYTIYPKSLERANYQNVKDDLFRIYGTAKDSHFYEWTCCAISFANYLKTVSNKKVGCLGTKGGALIAWHLASLGYVDALGVLYNAGWNTYKQGAKFSEFGDGILSENDLLFSAGFDAQSYANHVKCPVFFLTATNNPIYDIDRAYDTISRLKVPYIFNYTLAIDGSDYESTKDCNLFLTNYLNGFKGDIVPQFEGDSKLLADKIVATFSVKEEDAKQVDDIYLLVSKNQMDPLLRSWQKIENYAYADGKYSFNIALEDCDTTVYFFAKIKLKNGFVISTNMLNERRKAKTNNHITKSVVVYSSREDENVCSFLGLSVNSDTRDSFVQEKAGPMGIKGATIKQGLVTFKVNTEQTMPKEDAILMFDIFAEKNSEVKVSLLFDIRGIKTEYFAKAKILGGNIWHNIKFEIQNFKTAEGKPLRSYKSLNAVEFFSSEGGLINNILWI